jgi:hypothetical protein
MTLRPGPIRGQILVTAALLATVAVTNRWLSFTAGFRLLRAHDEIDYRTIAVAAPHFPNVPVGEQHAQRFIPHYLVGLVARGLDANVDTVYLVAAILAALALSSLLAAAVSRIQLSLPAFAVCMAVFVLNAYTLRYYFLVPAELSDLLLVVGLMIALLGLIRGNYWIVVLGVAFATDARQTALPATLAVAYWLSFGPGWRDAASRVRAARALGALVTSAALYLVMVVATSSFSQSDTPGFAHLTVLADLERLPAGAGQLGQHVLRTFNALLAVLALLAAIALSRTRARRAARLPFEFWGCLLLGVSVAAQPLVLSPGYAAHNETRLAVQSLPFFVCALAYAMQGYEGRFGAPLTAKAAAAILALLAVGSLHHLYTTIGASTASQTVAIQLVTALCAATVCLISLRRVNRIDIGTSGTDGESQEPPNRQGI